MTGGEWNMQILILSLIGFFSLLNMFRRLWTEISILETLLNSKDRLVSLKNVACFVSELGAIELKHVNEFITIFSVKDIPKKPLRKYQAVELENVLSHVTRDDCLFVTIGDTRSLDIKVYTQVPVWVLNEVLIPTPPTEEVVRKGWWKVVGEIFSRKRHFDSHRDSYFSIDGARHPDVSSESVESRIDRLLTRFKFKVELNREFQIDSRKDETEPVVPIVVIACRRDSHSMTYIELLTSEEVITVHFDRSRRDFSAFSCIPEFYGIEDRICTICCDAPIDTLMIDCCHCATCETCANSLRDGRCPICRKPITEKIIIPIVR